MALLSPTLILFITNQCLSPSSVTFTDSSHIDEHTESRFPIPAQKWIKLTFLQIPVRKIKGQNVDTGIMAARFTLCKCFVVSVKHGQLIHGRGRPFHPTRLIQSVVAPGISSVIKFLHTVDRNIIGSKCSLLCTLRCPGLFTCVCVSA